MSESEWYWPTENGKYLVNVREKYVEFLNLENGLWHSPANHELTFTTEHLRRCGYLGVRREPTPVNQAEPDVESSQDALNWRAAVKHGIEVTVDGLVIGKSKFWEDSGDPDVGLAASGGWELQGSEYGELCRKANQAENNAAIAKQALAEWRECKQAPKAADWAYKWAHRLCVMMGAE